MQACDTVNENSVLELLAQIRACHYISSVSLALSLCTSTQQALLPDADGNEGSLLRAWMGGGKARADTREAAAPAKEAPLARLASRASQRLASAPSTAATTGACASTSIRGPGKPASRCSRSTTPVPPATTTSTAITTRTTTTTRTSTAPTPTPPSGAVISKSSSAEPLSALATAASVLEKSEVAEVGSESAPEDAAPPPAPAPTPSHHAAVFDFDDSIPPIPTTRRPVPPPPQKSPSPSKRPLKRRLGSIGPQSPATPAKRAKTGTRLSNILSTPHSTTPRPETPSATPTPTPTPSEENVDNQEQEADAARRRKARAKAKAALPNKKRARHTPAAATPMSTPKFDPVDFVSPQLPPPPRSTSAPPPPTALVRQSTADADAALAAEMWQREQEFLVDTEADEMLARRLQQELNNTESSPRTKPPVLRRHRHAPAPPVLLDGEDLRCQILSAPSRAASSSGSESESSDKSANKFWKKHYFIITLGSEGGSSQPSTATASRSRKKQLHRSESVMARQDLEKIIREHGGSVVELTACLKHVKSPRSANVVVLSRSHQRTTKYLCALALGVPPLHVDWVLECHRRKRSVPINEFVLNRGVNLDDRIVGAGHMHRAPMSLPLPVRVESRLLYGLTCCLLCVDVTKEMKQSSSTLLQAAGARMTRSAASCDVLIVLRAAADARVPRPADISAPVVAFEWIVQSLIQDRRLPYDACSQFLVEFEDE